MSIFEAILWLTLNIYHEARSDDLIGKKAVVHVTLNRANNRNLSIKETIQQPYQFSWVHQLEDYTPYEWDAFFKCMEAVKLAVNEFDFTYGATHYHLETVHPKWADDPNMYFIGKFGSHLFYKEGKPIVIQVIERDERMKRRVL